MTGYEPGSMSAAVSDSLRTLGEEIPEQDRGAAALARKYAALIDESAPSATYAKHLLAIREALDVLRVEGIKVFGYDVDKAYDAIVIALSDHSVASDLGPKLLAALNALGLTPAGRAERGGGKTDDGRRTGSKTDELRAKRESRAQRAGSG